MDLSPTEPSRPAPDPDLAAERTELAWSRSGLAVLAAVAIMVRRLWPLEGDRVSVVLVVTAAGAMTWAFGMLMARRLGGAPARLTRMHAKTLTGGTLVLAAAALILTFTTPG
jgi:uncharacterized membrane protein YidH (DUF202 family)